MAAATNEAIISWLHENCHCMGEGITLLIGEDVNWLREIFLVGEMSKILAVGWDSPPISRVSHKGSMEGEAFHIW